MNQKVLITGGCGFVGRHFAYKLLTMGEYEVTLVDDLSTGLSPNEWPQFLKPKKEFRFIKADAREFFLKSTESFDLVLHLAAVVGGRMTIEGDPLKVATDLAIDAGFFNWLAKLRPMPKKAVYFSSSAAYPINLQTRGNNILLCESMIDFSQAIGVPDMSYGWSKLTGEFLTRLAIEKYGLNVIIYRPFSGYGEDQDLTYPFPSIVKRVAKRESPIAIWGSGDQKRDFIHIDDCVDAVLSTMFQLSPGEALNLSSGIGTSFFELASMCMQIMGYSSELKSDPSKPEGVFARVGSNKNLSKYYAPRISLQEGIERAIKYLS
ncbi:MAG: NAD-dependent epimerase/dehydratase family protein [Candidatus Margulisbacteria bacterium]|nr:NAD-dependent epimerase/dehydratase family protein [Candidatus Margulisiibacteriota bacterium]